MSNEEINFLINQHIEELENGIQQTEVQKKRVIEALKQASQFISNFKEIDKEISNWE